MGWAHVRDQGLAGLMLQLLKGGSTDLDRQGYSCGEGCAYGPGFQMAGAFSLQAEHNLSHAGYLLLCGSILGLLRRERRCVRIRGVAPAGTCRRMATALNDGVTPNDGSYVWEWWYKIQVTENITVRPALIYLSCPFGQVMPAGESFS
jgi:hypothetical protein